MGEEKFKLEFTLTELSIILKGCKELPWKESAGIINGILKQHGDIQKERELAAKDTKKEE